MVEFVDIFQRIITLRLSGCELFLLLKSILGPLPVWDAALFVHQKCNGGEIV
jgi:hypothetical protein